MRPAPNCTTHSDDEKDVICLVLLGHGLAGHGDCSVQEGGEVGGAVQLHLAQGELVRTKDALHTIVHAWCSPCAQWIMHAHYFATIRWYVHNA